jgi:hypothetical protein
MADQPPGAELRFLLHDRVQQHVGVQAALHQRRDLAGTGGHGGLQRRLLGAVGGHDPAFAMIQVRMIRDPPDLGLGAVKHRQDQPGLGGLHRTGQRIGAARMHDAGQHRFEIPTALDQPFEPMLRHLDVAAVSSAPALPGSRSQRPDRPGPCTFRPARRSPDPAASPARRAASSSPRRSAACP